ncbi:MAG: SDR family NAD(P)-dependent oxidoreductase [Candidatus Hodarchaeota archaeon]
MSNFMDWEDPGVALITGASSGIGAEFARQLAAQGFDTVLVARRKGKLEEIAGEIGKEGGKHDVFVADLANEESILQVAQEIKSIGNLDILINNAGFGTLGSFQDVEMKQQLDMLSVHVNATVHLSRAAIDVMLPKKRGVIINLTSLASVTWYADHVMYCSTKAFIRAFSESLQVDLNKTGIRVQALCPGYTRTQFRNVGDYAARDFHRSFLPDEMYSEKEEVVRHSLKAFKTKAVTVVPGENNQNIFIESLSRDLRKLKRYEKKISELK